MAREFAQIHLAIWSDEDWRELRVSEQHAYWTLLAQPKLSYCGVLDYIPNRLGGLAKGHTEAAVENAVEGLEKARFVVVDRDSQELLVRTFVRNDGLLKYPNTVKSMVRDYTQILSPMIRRTVAQELRKEYAATPGHAGWKSIRDGLPDLWEKVTEIPSEIPSDYPYEDPSDMGYPEDSQ